mmetsp:Transcript_35113/g.54870  ORF Transcript_35113/g.54870 Transcript_35113/m.54870 type:complete len:206 (+) Transcript_35113:383-1000(+)
MIEPQQSPLPQKPCLPHFYSQQSWHDLPWRMLTFHSSSGQLCHLWAPPLPGLCSYQLLLQVGPQARPCLTQRRFANPPLRCRRKKLQILCPLNALRHPDHARKQELSYCFCPPCVCLPGYLAACCECSPLIFPAPQHRRPLQPQCPQWSWKLPPSIRSLHRQIGYVPAPHAWTLQRDSPRPHRIRWTSKLQLPQAPSPREHPCCR